MAWPHPTDYNEAIQNPTQSFKDADLRQGRAATDALGLPRPCSGNFADVYRIDTPASGKSWAVKCFTKEVPGLQKRYQAISDHLHQTRQKGGLPFMVDFAYLDQGILIKGQWFPILKMRWVEGHALNTFVKDLAGKPQTLLVLAQLWQRLAHDLRAADMAHGDLQHGNVMLVPGAKAGSVRPTLIDYDGMFVAALARTKSGEVGHPNYQHPERLRDGTYHGEVDRFSHLVVYTALRCLAAEGKPIWDRYDNGDNLLFREQDFKDPGTSPLFQELWKTKDDTVRPLVGRLLLASQDPLDQVPLLEDLVGNGQVPLLTANQDKRIAGLLTAAGGRVRSVPKFVAGAPGTQTTPHRTPFPGKSVPPGAPSAPGKSAPIPFLPQGSWWNGGGANAQQPPKTPPQPIRPSPIPHVFPQHGRKPHGFSASSPSPVNKARVIGLVVGFVFVVGIIIAALSNPPAAKNTKPLTQAKAPINKKPNPLTNPILGPPKARGQEDRRFVDHEDQVNCVAWTPDGRLAVSGSKDKTIRLWEVNTGKALGRLAHPAEVICLAISPSGLHMASGGNDANVRLWEMKTGRELASFSMVGSVSCVGFSADSRKVLAGGSQQVLMWDIQSKQELFRIKSWSGGFITCAALTPEDEIVVGTDSGAFKSIDVKTGREVRNGIAGTKETPFPKGWLFLDISPGGRWVLWGQPTGKDKGLMLWDRKASLVFQQTEPFKDHPLRWDAKTGLEHMPDTPGYTPSRRGRFDRVESLSGFALAPNGRTVLTGASDKIVRLWKLPEWGKNRAPAGTSWPLPATNNQGPSDLPKWQDLEKPPEPMTEPKTEPKPDPAFISSVWVIEGTVPFIMDKHPLVVLEQNPKKCQVLDAKQLELVRVADGKILARGAFHVFEVPTKEPISITWKGGSSSRNARVFLSWWDGQKMSIPRNERIGDRQITIRVKPAQGETKVYVMAYCDGGKIATDFLGLAEKPFREKAEPALFARAWLIQGKVPFIMDKHPLVVLRQNPKLCQLLDEEQVDLVRAGDGKMLEKGNYHIFEIPAKEAIYVTWKGRTPFNLPPQRIILSCWDGKKMSFTNAVFNAKAPLTIKAAPAQGEDKAYVMVDCGGETISTDFLGLGEKPANEKLEPMLFARAWLIQGKIVNILRKHPLDVLLKNPKQCQVLDEKQLELVRAADGKMLNDGAYHVFEIPTAKALAVTWQGRAPRNKAVYFSLWNGQRMSSYSEIFAGLPVKLNVVPALGDKNAYLMVHCSAGAFATDCLTLDILKEEKKGPPEQGIGPPRPGKGLR